MGQPLWLAIVLSCLSICGSRGYEYSTKYKSFCLCADRYELDGSWEIPLILQWSREVPLEDRKAESIGPTFPRYNLLSPEDE